ncbi:MAG: efflux RND transporter permease subunit, partial [Desulfocucumaceae bacterium]
FFLREWRSTFIVTLAIPTSIIATLTMMYFAGFSFNLLTLLAIATCIGILVDDSIVVLENIHRHRVVLGKDPVTAAIDGRSEIGMAAIAITLSDVVVFGPIAFMSGMVGQFFKQFGFTVICAALFSLLVSFTLTPMLASLLYKSESREAKEEREKRAKKPPGRWAVFQLQLYRRYEAFLNYSLSHRGRIMLVCLLAPMLVFSLLPLHIVKTEFMPQTDQNKLTISLEMPPGTSLAETDAALAGLEKKAMQTPGVESVFSTVGRSGEQYMGTVNAQSGNVAVRLAPREKRTLSQSEIAGEMRYLGDDIPGARVSVLEPTGVHPQMAPIIINISGPDPDRLQPLAERVKQIVMDTPGAADVDSTWRIGQPELQAEINRQAADYYGLTVKEIASAVRMAVDGEVSTAFREGGRETDLRVLVAGANRYDVSQLGEVGIMNGRGQIIPLRQLADLKVRKGPTEIMRFNRQRLITIKANLAGRPLGEVMQDIQEEINSLVLPPGFDISYQGETRDMQESFVELLRAMIISIVFVYAILVMLYESFLAPLIRMLSLPLGMVGALLALAVTGSTLNLLSFIGLIMLDGLVAKNGTLLIDYTHTLMRREGLPLRTALVKAGTTRLRPIIMTSVTMIVGMLPIAVSTSVGSEMRAGMAIALIGGLVLSTLLTLVVIPVAYTYMDDFRGKIRGRRLEQKPPQVSCKRP